MSAAATDKTSAHDPYTSLVDAIAEAGGQNATARLLGVSEPTVHLWLRDRKPMPAEHVLKIETATSVSRHDLRPDLYPREDGPAQPPASHAPVDAGGSSLPAKGARS